MYILNLFTCLQNVNKPSHELRSHNNLKHYPKVLVKTLLINFTRTDHKLVSTFTINVGFTKILDTF